MKFFYCALFVLSLFMGCSTSITEGPQGQGGTQGPGDSGGSKGATGSTPGQGSGDQGLNIDRDLAITQYLVKDIMDPAVMEMQRATNSLKDSFSKSCHSGKTTSVDVLREQWEKAMLGFHRSEVFLFGPILIEDENHIGDENPIKGQLYSLIDPGQQAQAIDPEISKAFEQNEQYRPRAKKSILGFDALEYVLFARLQAEDHLSQESEECVYLNYVVSELSDRVSQVVSQWRQKVSLPLNTPNGQTKGRFYLDRLTKGMVHYFDKGLKDRKLAVPLGMSINESQPFPCELGVDCHVRYADHYYSRLGRQAIILNLQTLEKAFGKLNDNKNFGYNNYLRELGVPTQRPMVTLAEKQLSGYWRQLPAGDEYSLAFAQYDGSSSLENPIYRGFRKLKEITDWFKVDFIVDMNLELPTGVQGDND